MGYQDLANSYSHELQQGTQMQAQAGQQMVQGQQSLYDRFQQAYLQRQQMARQAEMDRRQQEQDRLAQEQQQWSRKRIEGNDAMTLEDKLRDDRRAFEKDQRGIDVRGLSEAQKNQIKEEAKRIGIKDYALPEVTYTDTPQRQEDFNGPVRLDKPEFGGVDIVKQEDELSGRGIDNRSAMEKVKELYYEKQAAAAAAVEARKEKDKADKEFKAGETEKQRQFMLALKSMGAGMGSGLSDLRAQLLQAQIDEKRGKVEAKDAAGQAEKDSVIEATDDMLQQITKVRGHKGLTAAIGFRNPLKGGMPAGYNWPGSPAAGFNAELETLKAKAFLPQVKKMKGMGSLSNAEGLKLTAAIGALENDMPEKEFVQSLDYIYSTLEKGRNKLAGKKATPGANPPSANQDRDMAMTALESATPEQAKAIKDLYKKRTGEDL